jgi:PAS domain S-box-containing protein
MGLPSESTQPREPPECDRLLRVFFDTGLVAVFTIDAAGTFRHYDGTLFQRSLEVDPRTLVGRSIFDVFARAPEFLAQARRALQGETVMAISDLEAVGASWETWWTPTWDAERQVKEVLALTYDVTRYRRVERALGDTSRRLQAILQASPVALIGIDRQERVDFWNRAAENVFGWTAAEVLGETLPYAPAARLEEARAVVRLGFDGVVTGGLELERQRKDGSLVTVRSTLARIRDERHRVVGLVEAVLDLSEHKQAERALEHSISLLHSTLESTADGILVVDSSRRIVRFNRRFVDLWRIPEAVLASSADVHALECVGDQIRDFEGFLRKVRELYARPEAQSFDSIDLKDGRVFERLSRPQLLDGKPVGRVWSFRDVTSERRADREREEALALAEAARKLAEEARRRSALLAQASALLATSLDSEGGLRRVAALSLPELGEAAIFDVVAPDHTTWAFTEVSEAEARGHAPELVAHVPEPVAAEGEAGDVPPPLRAAGVRASLTVPLMIRGTKLGKLTFCSFREDRRYGPEDEALARDLAERVAYAIDNRRLLFEAELSARELRAAQRVREEFISVASHELRTPLASLLLGVQSLARMDRRKGAKKDGPLRSRTLETIERQSKRLARLIDDLIDESRMRGGTLTLTLVDVDLAEVARETVEELRPELAAASCPITVHADGPVVGHWDRARLEQILANLLSNALRFGAGSPIDVTVSADVATARVVVRDEGIGIPKEALERVFDRFMRGVSPRSYGGLGLGLYMVRSLATALGGSVRVESSPGAGSTFTVELPRKGPRVERRAA